MTEQTRALAARWYEEVWNQDNEAAIDELMDPAGEAFGFPALADRVDREGFKAAFRQIRASFSEIHITLNDTVVEADKLATRWTATMKHTGDGLSFAATNESVTVTGMGFIHALDGRILRAWNAFDLTSEVIRLQSLAR